ncbi:hypothetical protein VNO77_23104 [Canavalia gladiata]|uniref:Uncharacterized protein n=1 Tax=Canavalia gladiata TaxID=3824 RepID=A0AAN9L4E2_CANGL
MHKARVLNIEFEANLHELHGVAWGLERTTNVRMGFVALCIALLALAKSWGHLQAFGLEPSKCVLGHGPLEARAWQRLKVVQSKV